MVSLGHGGSIPTSLGYGDGVHVVIMGCGRVGSTLAKSLEKRHHTVSVIDTEESAFRRLGETFNGDTVTGVGFDRSVLIRAGIERADAFVPTRWANRLVYAEVLDNYLTRIASDHLPLLLEWDLHSCYMH